MTTTKDAHARPRGRPVGTTRVAEPRRSVASWLAASEHDRLIRAANAERRSVSDFIRRVLILTLR
jgi:hypothetical protein